METNSSKGRSNTASPRRLLLRKRISCLSEAKKGSVGSCQYRPDWTGAIEGYTVRNIHKNMWRFGTLCTFDDVYQEAYIKFMELSAKYEGRVDNPRWFMGLYKRALENRITDFANQANRLRRQVCFCELQIEDDVPYVETLLGDLSTANLEILLEQAPEHVRQVLNLLTSNHPGLLSVLADSWEEQGKRKESGNQFLCKLLGYNHRQVDLVWATKQYLEEA